MFAIIDKHDGRPRQACVLLHNLSSIAQPNGIAYDRSSGSLYIAGVSVAVQLTGAGNVFRGAVTVLCQGGRCAVLPFEPCLDQPPLLSSAVHCTHGRSCVAALRWTS